MNGVYATPGCFACKIAAYTPEITLFYFFNR